MAVAASAASLCTKPVALASKLLSDDDLDLVAILRSERDTASQRPLELLNTAEGADNDADVRHSCPYCLRSTDQTVRFFRLKHVTSQALSWRVARLRWTPLANARSKHGWIELRRRTTKYRFVFHINTTTTLAVAAPIWP